jgi:hypothetical protein
MNQSVQLAKLWTTLDHVKDQLDNVAIPLESHLNLNDPQLTTSMEELSANIKSHFEKFELVTEAHRAKQG